MNAQNPPVSLPLDDLVVDNDNPRLADSALDEKSAIMGILAEQGQKLVVLAKHVAAHGLSPFEFPAVFPNEDGKYLVAEGNRRIAALKILNDPSIIAGADKKLIKGFEAILAAKPSLPDTILCVLLQSEAERNRWITLRHTGQNSGRGLVEWGAKEQARYNSRHQAKGNRMEFGLKVIELLQARGGLTTVEADELRKIPITTLERMLGDPVVRAALGIERSTDGIIVVINDEAAVIDALKALALEIARKEVQVGKMMNKQDREDLVKKWPEHRKPGTSGEPAPHRLLSMSVSTPLLMTPAQPSAKRFRPRSPDDRKVLIPPATMLNLSTHPRIKRVFIELKKLAVEEFENAVAVLLRVFLELSVDAYLKQHNIPSFENDKLRAKMEKVASHWETTQALSRNEIKAWRNAASSHHLFSLNVLHAYLHSQHSIPKKRDLMRTWDEMEMYFNKLWP